VSFSKRTVACGEVSDGHVGQNVVLNGWVNRNRDQGGIVFIDLRDRTGIVQVVADGSRAGAALETAEKLRSEFCVSVTGLVRRRPEGTENPNLKTIIPHHHRVQPPQGAPTPAMMEAALKASGLPVTVLNPDLKKVYELTK